jgi:hypothetical protein
MTPHALPMFRDEDYRQTKRKKEKERADPVKSHKPQEPLKGAGRGGRVGASATQHLVQHMFRNTMRDEDVSTCFWSWIDYRSRIWCVASRGFAQVRRQGGNRSGLHQG